MTTPNTISGSKPELGLKTNQKVDIHLDYCPYLETFKKMIFRVTALRFIVVGWPIIDVRTAKIER